MKLTRDAFHSMDVELQAAIADDEDVREWTPEGVERLLLRPGNIGESFELKPGDLIESIKEWQKANPSLAR